MGWPRACSPSSAAAEAAFAGEGGRNAELSACVIDARSVKTRALPAAGQGVDAGKKIAGCKTQHRHRHPRLPLVTAASVQDSVAHPPRSTRTRRPPVRIRKGWVDADTASTSPRPPPPWASTRGHARALGAVRKRVEAVRAGRPCGVRTGCPRTPPPGWAAAEAEVEALHGGLRERRRAGSGTEDSLLVEGCGAVVDGAVVEVLVHGLEGGGSQALAGADERAEAGGAGTVPPVLPRGRPSSSLFAGVPAPGDGGRDRRRR
ncbi:hypothetical protein SAVIM40S_07751 [Streptomyces avidinii]